MLLALLALIGVIPLQGDLKMTIETATYPETDSSYTLELSYEIPFTSLSFARSGESYAARFEIGIQLADRRGNLVAGDIWRRSVTVSGYDATIARDSAATGVASLSTSATATRARADVSDETSDRRASVEFQLSRPDSGLILRLFRSGRPSSSRHYSLADTLDALVRSMRPGAAWDSFTFTILRNKLQIAAASLAALDSAGCLQARFLFPFASADSPVRLGAGEYMLEVVGKGTAKQARAAISFRMEVPFFLDDAAYHRKVGQLLYVATYEEMKKLKSLPAAEREEAWRGFWKARDRTPTTERNEREDEYFQRIDYAEEHFQRGDKGCRSDRGEVYVRYGPPDQIESRPFEIDMPALEVWYYYESGKTFQFVDRYGSGQFVLLNREVLDVR